MADRLSKPRSSSFELAGVGLAHDARSNVGGGSRSDANGRASPRERVVATGARRVSLSSEQSQPRLLAESRSSSAPLPAARHCTDAGSPFLELHQDLYDGIARRLTRRDVLALMVVSKG